MGSARPSSAHSPPASPPPPPRSRCQTRTRELTLKRSAKPPALLSTRSNVSRFALTCLTQRSRISCQLMISPRSSADRKSCFFVSNRSKQTLRHLISSTARPVASLISSKSIPSYGSGILILEVEEEVKQVVSGQKKQD